MSAHSSPTADLHRRGVRESLLKPRNGEAYVPFGDQEVPCMCRHWRTSLRTPRITFIYTQYTIFSCFGVFFFGVQIGCETYAAPGIKHVRHVRNWDRNCVITFCPSFPLFRRGQTIPKFLLGGIRNILLPPFYHLLPYNFVLPQFI